MSYILKYSGEDRDYFITSDLNLKPYEFIVHKFHCKNRSEVNTKMIELFNSFRKLGLIEDHTNGKNTSHLQTTNRDMFRMFVLKEYGVD